MYDLVLQTGNLLDLETLTNVSRIGGGAAVFLWTFMWLLRRGDSLQRENIEELRDQRDDYRERYEESENTARRLRAERDALKHELERVEPDA